jgi:hypothetical protein
MNNEINIAKKELINLYISIKITNQIEVFQLFNFYIIQIIRQKK